jgi:hypothetical protein
MILIAAGVPTNGRRRMTIARARDVLGSSGGLVFLSRRRLAVKPKLG